MATIAVRVGREVKEISGLTKSTTCWDVTLALLKEKQQNPGTDSANGATDKTQSGEQGNAESSSNCSTAKSIKELAQSYVIVENWRGCEKPIPPRTRILNVWQAWGKEQKHVELSLKKSKHIRYRDGGHLPNRGKDVNDGVTANDHHSLHYMSHHQKRRIRRNMKQYQRAVMMKQTMDDVVDSDELPNQEENKQILFEDFDNNNKPTKSDTKTSEKRNGLILSEEKFVDGFLADPDCLVRRSDRAQLISQGTFNREFCKYRRRNHRRMSSVDGVVGSRQHRRRQVPHYPYSSHHYRRRSSRHRGSRSKSQKSALYRYSTDDTSTTTTTTTNTSEDENAQDADDEKSVLIEFSGPIPRRNHSYNAGLGGRAYGGAATTATDSSTTTSGDSMTSSMGCSTSSETSSGGDYYFPELNRLTYGRIPLDNTKLNKPSENSSNKPKKNKSILGGFSKPALNLIESFRKTNLKRKSTKKNNQTPCKHETVPENDTETEKCVNDKKSEIIADRSTEKCENVIKAQEVPEKSDPVKSVSENTTSNCENDPQKEEQSLTEEKAVPEDEATEDTEGDEVLQTVQSQDIVVQNQQHRLADIDAQIEQIEHDIHNLRTRALGKNYVQDTYLSGLMDSESNSVTALNTLLSGPSIPVTTPWILQCEDVEQLEEYIKNCEKIVEMQLKIGETQRKSEIILQDMQEEVWRVSTDSTQNNPKGVNPVTKAAALMLGFSDEDDVSDDETGHELLSVKSWNEHTVDKTKTSSVKDASSTDLNSGKGSLSLELGASRTELEASLYLSLRLAAEIDEVEHKLGTSDYLIQAKGENLIKCVRDLAMSEEGIDPEIWEEYGELLTAYDLEVHQRNYLDVLEASHMAVLEAETASGWLKDENTHYIDATQPNPTSHCMNGQSNGHVKSVGQMPGSTSGLHQALTPWVWCEHCKMEEQMKHAQHAHIPAEVPHKNHVAHHPVNVKAHPPASFSDLPLPKPINRNPPLSNNKSHTPSVIKPGLLPMLPLPDGLMSPPRYNDSDYEDLPDLTNMGGKSDVIPKNNSSKDSRNHGLLPNALSASADSSNSTDDSGNASAGSTTSFASSDGSRNSSCDGGSPRPIPNVSEGSKPIFGRNGVLRSSLKAAGNHFVFPINSKQNNNSQSHSSSQGKSSTHSSKPLPPPPPPANMKPKMKKPELLPKPAGQLQSKNTTPIDTKEQELLMQQQKLIRRNNSGWRKNITAPKSPRSIPPPSPDDRIFNFKEPMRFQNPANQISQKSMSTDLKSNLNYDNDSDTGRSSLHSVDSDQVVSETLV